MGEKRLLEWSIRSSDNVADIRDYIAYNNPQAAQNVLGEIRRVANSLCTFPMLGHVGRRAGTRACDYPIPVYDCLSFESKKGAHPRGSASVPQASIVIRIQSQSHAPMRITSCHEA